MINRVQIFLATGFLTALGVTVSFRYGKMIELTTDPSITGPDYLCHESAC